MPGLRRSAGRRPSRRRALLGDLHGDGWDGARQRDDRDHDCEHEPGAGAGVDRSQERGRGQPADLHRVGDRRRSRYADLQCERPADGATFDPATKTFGWTPSFTQSGPYSVTFTVTDGTAPVSETVAITIANTNRAPVLASIGPKSGAEGSLLTFTVSATDADLDRADLQRERPAGRGELRSDEQDLQLDAGLRPGGQLPGDRLGE